MQRFIRNIWYVAAWKHEVSETPVGRQVIGMPLVLWRRADGSCVAMEDRCPHRQAPLSMGRVEGDTLKCMYHGLRFSQSGQCIGVPGAEQIPADSTVTTYPVVEQDGWIWVWLGDASLADPALVPKAFGIEGPAWTMRSGVLDYDADYMLVNDNLTDLSHLDYTHENSLSAASGSRWSDDLPRVQSIENGLVISRWVAFRSPAMDESRPEPVETYNSYQYLLPGVFLMRTRFYPLGTGESVGFGDPGDIVPAFEQVDQQAITPVAEGRSRYFYACGAATAVATPEFLDGQMSLLNRAFEEDRIMIQAQQRNWNMLAGDRRMAFIPQDKAPHLFRQMIQRALKSEQAIGAHAEAVP